MPHIHIWARNQFLNRLFITIFCCYMHEWHTHKNIHLVNVPHPSPKIKMNSWKWTFWYSMLLPSTWTISMYLSQNELSFVLFNDIWSQLDIQCHVWSYSHTYQSRHQNGLSAWWLHIWPLQSSPGVCVGMYGLTYSLYHPRGFMNGKLLTELYILLSWWLVQNLLCSRPETRIPCSLRTNLFQGLQYFTSWQIYFSPYVSLGNLLMRKPETHSCVGDGVLDYIFTFLHEWMKVLWFFMS